MNGFEATRVIRGLEEGKNDKISGALSIALTGLASGSDQAEGFDSGVDLVGGEAPYLVDVAPSSQRCS